MQKEINSFIPPQQRISNDFPIEEKKNTEINIISNA